MFAKRTDLAVEAKEIWQEGVEKATKLPGVKASKKKLEGYALTKVEILNRPVTPRDILSWQTLRILWDN